MKKTTLTVGLAAALSLAGAAWAADTPAPASDPTDLKTIMVGLGEHMTQVQAALWLEDFDAIRAGAVAIADHAKVGPEERQRVQAALGADFGAFVTGDRAVHDQAMSLSEAAAAEDLDRTVQRLAELQAGCVACHTSFRPRLAR